MRYWSVNWLKTFISINLSIILHWINWNCVQGYFHFQILVQVSIFTHFSIHCVQIAFQKFVMLCSKPWEYFTKSLEWLKRGNICKRSISYSPNDIFIHFLHLFGVQSFQIKCSYSWDCGWRLGSRDAAHSY